MPHPTPDRGVAGESGVVTRLTVDLIYIFYTLVLAVHTKTHFIQIKEVDFCPSVTSVIIASRDSHSSLPMAGNVTCVHYTSFPNND